MDWRHKAACLTEDPELFFPVGNTGPALQQIEEAKKICQRCEVRERCLSWALEAGQDHGVWGGMSEDERRAIKRRAARSGCAPDLSRGAHSGTRMIAAVPGLSSRFLISRVPFISFIKAEMMASPRLV